MSTCKDCIHWKACKALQHTWEKIEGTHYPLIAEKCKIFKDRSKFIELPCKVTVNMSLAHYDGMKDCIRVQKQNNKILNSDNERLIKMFISIGIPRDCIPAIVPNSFSLSECKNISGRFDRFRRIKIAFDVDSEKLREVGR